MNITNDLDFFEKMYRDFGDGRYTYNPSAYYQDNVKFAGKLTNGKSRFSISTSNRPLYLPLSFNINDKVGKSNAKYLGFVANSVYVKQRINKIRDEYNYKLKPRQIKNLVGITKRASNQFSVVYFIEFDDIQGLIYYQGSNSLEFLSASNNSLINIGNFIWVTIDANKYNGNQIIKDNAYNIKNPHIFNSSGFGRYRHALNSVIYGSGITDDHNKAATACLDSIARFKSMDIVDFRTYLNELLVLHSLSSM